ncbi:MAG: molybdopterin-dependent oxidoreductase [Chloroflexi bacterium]|nr:molybdopterin-dependent oxidoreductase [Chloroflexota bacterium]
MGAHGRVPLRVGFWAGLAAGVAMVFFMVALRLAFGGSSLIEVLAEWFVALAPARVFALLLETLLQYGKPLLLVSLSVLLVGAGGLVGATYGLVHARWGVALDASPWKRGLLLAFGLWVVTGLGLLPLAGGGVFGVHLQGGAVRFSLTSFAGYAIYGLALASLYGQAMRPPAAVPGEGRSRRVFLQRMGLVALGVGLLGLGLRSILSGARRMSPSKVNTRTVGVMPPEVTPSEHFYAVSKNLVDPVVDLGRWKLELGGLVERPLVFTYDELRALPSVEQYVTLECIGNPVGGSLISNALWKGVPLRRLLGQAGVKAGVRKVAFHAWDGYSDSIPLGRALQDEVLVAYEMNGQPLSDKHGFPARLLVPGLYGLKSVKWLTRIEPVDRDFQGYWQGLGWGDQAEVQATSQILVPEPGGPQPLSPLPLGGIAFSGDKGISGVEVSGDGGRTWHPATVKEPLSPYTWVLWTGEWVPEQGGVATLLVRATDARGHVQVREARGSLPDGATGYHAIAITFVSQPGEIGG